ncbi:MAG: hypothetical protein HC840_31515 [Leptolyngbyaceae cyanobacterium RM2_2_4]|nr:hypothetical protein [Leptolyngbyaceae cyanobacterium SM1_4_3]NJO53183.1 hypothetical protein [Leptolyngbyaceae cyanobacterium RM2_2_4]
MATTSFTAGIQSPGDEQVWDSLKRAIASSSGFKRWQTERGEDRNHLPLSQDQLVSRYLRETLETLAY